MGEFSRAQVPPGIFCGGRRKLENPDETHTQTLDHLINSYFNPTPNLSCGILCHEGMCWDVHNTLYRSQVLKATTVRPLTLHITLPIGSLSGITSYSELCYGKHFTNGVWVNQTVPVLCLSNSCRKIFCIPERQQALLKYVHNPKAVPDARCFLSIFIRSQVCCVTAE